MAYSEPDLGRVTVSTGERAIASLASPWCSPGQRICTIPSQHLFPIATVIFLILSFERTAGADSQHAILSLSQGITWTDVLGGSSAT